MTLRLVVGIATAGRREQLSRTLRVLAQQRRPPERVVVCPAGPHDIDDAGAREAGLPLQVVFGARGLCAQRNRILEAVRDADLLLFIDDDFYPAPDYLEKLETAAEAHVDAVMFTGHVLADGASTAGIGHERALGILKETPRTAVDPGVEQPSERYGAYGCNMALRLLPVHRHGLAFDERLPLYGWLEDIDFSRRLARHGRVLYHPSLRGVHLGSKDGKSPGTRLGYSQVVNPLYMVRKGTVSWEYALRHVTRNVAANAIRSLTPEPWVDRRGRLRGNVLAVLDLLRGSLDPTRVLSVK